jgi:hypothetical protein
MTTITMKVRGFLGFYHGVKLLVIKHGHIIGGQKKIE